MESKNFNDEAGLIPKGLVDGRYVIELHVEPRHHNAMGSVHGGVLCTLLDTAMARSFLHSLPEEKRKGATLEMKINFLKTATTGRITAYGKLVNATKRTAYVEGHAEDDDGRLLAKASATIILFAEKNG